MSSPIFLVIFSATVFQGSDEFVLFDSLDGNGALFANVLCDIPESFDGNLAKVCLWIL